MKCIQSFLYGLLYENREPSLTRCLYVAAFLFAVLLTVDAIHITPEYMDKIFDIVKQLLALVLGAKTADKIVNNVVAQFKGSKDNEMPDLTKNKGA